MRRHARLAGRARRERVGRGPEGARVVQRLRTQRLGRSGPRQSSERHKRDRRHHATPFPARLRTQHPQHLRQLSSELGHVPQAARTVARRSEAVPQPLHVVGDRAVDPGRAQCAGEPVAVPGPLVGDVAREHRVKLALQPSELGEPLRRGGRHGRGAVQSQRAAPPQPYEKGRTDEQHEPTPGYKATCHLVRPRRFAPARERRQRARRVRLDPGRHGQRARSDRRRPIVPRREIVVGVAHLGQEE